MRPSSSGSEPGLFDAVLARGPVADEVADRAWLRAMLDVETALAQAAASVGVVDPAHAAAVVEVCGDTDAYDVAQLGAEAADVGNPVLPLVRAIRAKLPADVAAAVHHGATSQDVLDSAMMLVARRASQALASDVLAAGDAAAALAEEHRDTPMAGRTLLQHAVPVTFGLKAAQWCTALDGAFHRLDATAQSLPVQYGGGAGTLGASGARALEVMEDLARQLDLRVPVLPWHTARLPVADIAGAVGATAGVFAKVATDIVLMAQTEVGELSEGVPGRGASSAMAHKANPVAAVSVRAAARRVPGLVATLLSCMEQEHERAAGAWHAEWPTLTELFRSTGSAAAWLRDLLENLVVHPDRMAANLVGSLMGDDPGLAAVLVHRALAARPPKAVGLDARS